jgi:hypothetical protein
LIAHLQKGKRNGKKLVSEYFGRIQAGDLKGLLNLFSNDSIIFEPFSKTKYLHGRLEIEPFLETVLLANKGMQNEIIIEREQNIDDDMIVALVTFHKGGSVTARYTFQLNYNGQERGTTIKSLNIEFIG